ncbi:asparagine synthase (glutamine-hydrolyzing) [Meiothermus taiwanensis WR-220]|uniref:asparagine synthase (glutamine-hydrolyzing) n=1 Tax=Meiothermus taiwanensis WR-220 TaxID=1339250 RepID=A0ABM6WKJ4_9DEIN|nr:asparagine synthase (glutamine-hydrolyzing) [Meiothermus taiwanensis]AWR87733.1 asparagine synthase (glutamine-hydrolyzing) [Meiothermus taiwanensis WR-220]KIQ54605.1 asparagine synthase [Meiothermus taiwanensis]KZK15265.1 asparagine synthetase B [Meiothermus taiwanensis]
MCGIAGLALNKPGTLNWAGRALEGLRHRGPDDRGWLVWSPTGAARRGKAWDEAPGSVLLVHRRLSILDLSELGWQPMSSPDGRYHLVFNGEIYNYLELRQELEALGHCFRSHSDTEVLLMAWAHWGTACLQRLVGMFAFAVLDTEEQSLHLVRDFFGIKPLYYCAFAGGVGFASEIPVLLELPGVGRQVHPEGLYRYLRFGLTDDGAQTLFSDIRQLPAAHYLRLDLNNLQLTEPQRYWQPRLQNPLELSFEEAAEAVRAQFLQNVRLHLRSDVPVGAALSGGIDSSAIVAAMRHLEPGLELHTFTYVADNGVSEEHWADLVGQAAGVRAHKVKPSAPELVADLDELVRVQGEPFGSTSIYAQYRVFRLAQEAGIKVMLDGQGADEVLAGYAVYGGARLASLVRQGRWLEALAFLRASRLEPALKDTWKSALGFLIPPRWQPLGRRLIGQDLAPAWLNAAWFAERGVPMASPRSQHGSEVLREELLQSLRETSLPKLLRYEDRNSMAHSIESRVPFLTPKLVELLLNLPEAYILSPQGQTKAVFRRAMQGLVPQAILDRKDKVGFATPEQHWLHQLAPWVHQLLDSETLGRIHPIQQTAVKEEFAAILAGRKPFDSRVWRWINLIAWARAFHVQFD